MQVFPEGVDASSLAAWMDERGLPGGPFEDVSVLTGGTQNILLEFERGGGKYVLRRPPVHKRGNSDATMLREARVLESLSGSEVPHPKFIASCDDIDVLGAAFYLMESVDGFNAAEGLPRLHAESDEIRFEMGLSMAEAIAKMGELDYIEIGLEGLGKPDGYLERQVKRWQGQLDSYREFEGYPGPDISGLDEVAYWLDDNLPRDYRPGLLHGDYHAANVMFRHDGPELAAIVDWELTTVGDPLLDLGALTALSAGTTNDPPLGHTFEGFPSRDAVLARYRTHSTRDTAAIEWYEILACYRLGIILEGTRARAFAGKASQETANRLRAITVACFDKAARRVGARV